MFFSDWRVADYGETRPRASGVSWTRNTGPGIRGPSSQKGFEPPLRIGEQPLDRGARPGDLENEQSAIADCAQLCEEARVIDEPGADRAVLEPGGGFDVVDA
jgi:hypothetical protein